MNIYVHICSHLVLYRALTIWEQRGNKEKQALREQQMANDIKTAIVRSRGTIIADAIGAAALLVMLFVGLSLPGMV